MVNAAKKPNKISSEELSFAVCAMKAVGVISRALAVEKRC